MMKYGSEELMNDVIRRNLCIGCGACLSLCPYLATHRGKTVMLFPCSREEGRCFAYCPKVEVDLDLLSRNIFHEEYDAHPFGSHLAVYRSKAGRKLERIPCQTAGSVTALVTHAMEKSLISAAVLTGRKGLEPIPEIITDPDLVSLCATSKYTAAPTLDAFNRAVREGYRSLGVVGTPCQVTALAQIRSNPHGAENFSDPTALVIGLFCTWALDFRIFRSLLIGKVDAATITRFDIPPPPAQVMDIYTMNKKITVPLREVRQAIPPGCGYCLDMTAEFSDISVGALEGIDSWNTLIVRTERGKAALDAAVKDNYLVISDMPKKYLARIAAAAQNKKTRAMEKIKKENLVNGKEEGRRCILRVNAGVIDEISAGGFNVADE